MSNALDSFLDQKEAESAFVSLKKSGDSVKILRVEEITTATKMGFNNEEKLVLRLVCLVDTVDGAKSKFFDQGTRRFAEELKEAGVKVGSSFELIRSGEGKETRYIIKDVKDSEVVTGESAAAALNPDEPAAS